MIRGIRNTHIFVLRDRDSCKIHKYFELLNAIFQSETLEISCHLPHSAFRYTSSMCVTYHLNFSWDHMFIIINLHTSILSHSFCTIHEPSLILVQCIPMYGCGDNAQNRSHIETGVGDKEYLCEHIFCCCHFHYAKDSRKQI